MIYRVKKIVLIGYMGAGKTLIGSELAKILGSNFIDLDTYIEQKENLSLQQLFSSKGEIYFRRKETECLRELLASPQSFVLASGGGTPAYASNMQKILESDAISIYLRANVTTLVQRLLNQIEQRPLLSSLKSEEDLIQFIGPHLLERSFYYNQAHLIVATDNLTVATVVQKILSLLE